MKLLSAAFLVVSASFSLAQGPPITPVVNADPAMAGKRVSAIAAQPLSPSPASVDPATGLIERARGQVASLNAQIPNFICRQDTTRYTAPASQLAFLPPVGRRTEGEHISARVVVQERKETYADITVNGKPTKRTMTELGGLWSTGEFASVLAEVFAPSTDAIFRYKEDAVRAGLPAAVYEFEVDQGHSHWLVMAKNSATKPAYRGTVWIDKEGARVLRVEMLAPQLPGKFPLRRVEITLDYDFAELGGLRLLLPARSQHLACNSRLCLMNSIDFRDYRRFTAESKIRFR